MRPLLFTVACLLPCLGALGQEQVMLPRVDEMPALPSPYAMRDWAEVARGYDAFAFDLDRTGTYLPVVWIDEAGANYPGHASFGLDTYVGSQAPDVGEAISVLPALISATLVGIDKSNQKGRNWVLMAEDYFNRRPGEGVYLNLPTTSSGGDWWYDTMPNVFFYQLYDLYPGTGDFDAQFVSVADRWLEAVEAMGGSATPWTVPEMSYRGWYLATMTPNTEGVPEPEAAGALAWLLYHAYVETGDARYRQGAEWAMEFLVSLDANPSYELQLPYGAYAAARMNAEMGTTYDVEQLLRWSFEVGPLRRWGVITGTWGGYDVGGLVGEVGANGYGFAMNTFQHVSALVPLVRYDDRFAQALGRWVLNAANAARLFYLPFLPPENQDSDTWGREYDPEGYLAHEALRQFRFGASPFATGDAIDGDWAATNLALYASSHAGLLGAIIDTTDVPGILQLDVLATDFFGGEAYPTYLYYNPHDDARTVQVDVGDEARDLYDAVTNRFLQQGVQGSAEFALGAGEAVLLVLPPAGGAATFEGERLLVDEVVVDYRSGRAAGNRPPRIKALAAAPASVAPSAAATLYCTAEDAEGDALTYAWDASAGALGGTDAAVTWTAPASEGTHTVACTVTDAEGAAAQALLDVEVREDVPTITSVTARPRRVDVGGTSSLTCKAHTPGGGPLTYAWQARAGTITGTGPEVQWTAPQAEGTYAVLCEVTTQANTQALDSVEVEVRVGVPAQLLAHYPLDGTALDASGFGRDGMVVGAEAVEGVVGQAFRFDGVDDAIVVPNDADLNVRDALSVSAWVRPDALPGREAFLVSHGSWQHRWKLSLLADGTARWTVHTDEGIQDLDASAPLGVSAYHHLAATYDGAVLRLYRNGTLDASVPFSGLLKETDFALLLGQMLPGDTQFNFPGVLDEVRLYNYALTPAEVEALAGMGTAVSASPGRLSATLEPNAPNPFSHQTTLRYRLPRAGAARLDVFNVLGQRVRTLVEANHAPGAYEVTWDGRDDGGARLASGVYVYRLQTSRDALSGTLTLIQAR